VKIAELVPEKKRARFECVCSVNGKPVVQGGGANGAGAASVSSLAAASEMNAGQRVPPMPADELRNPILHGVGILMIGGGIWTVRSLEATNV